MTVMKKVLLLVSSLLLAAPATDRQVQDRMKKDVAAGRPLVAHVIVCLADNQHQGIVPVRADLGDGQNPAENLYWGALYGVKKFMPTKAGWKLAPASGRLPEGMLDRVVLTRKLKRGKSSVPAFIVAEAWDGREIRKATVRFLEMAAGHHPVEINKLKAGSQSHLIAYVGHDGLMDFELDALPEPAREAEPLARSAVVLACMSKNYFEKPIRSAGAHALVLTTGLMAPEAYTLDAIVKSWFGGDGAAKAREAAARAYKKYQKCSMTAARSLFAGE
jgi:hypothetical protein